MHESSFRAMELHLNAYLANRLHDPLRVLDVGSMIVDDGFGRSYRELMPPSWNYIGVDLVPGKNVDRIMLGPYRIQDTPDDYDLIISGQCLEHVENPFRLVAEMARILKPGGFMFLAVPWFQNHHPYPLDCWRIFPDGMRALIVSAGLICLQAYACDLDNHHNYTGPRDCYGIASKPCRK